ncbi:MAG TPA: glycosyltransferase family 4 protein [Candidatus Acidoferrales bacterium]|nr:glycosyltransferase family 4 protein [Candidatus Acidoferrales bacterium]
MAEKKLRVLLVCTHPVQYSAPMWRLMVQRPELEIVVAYCSLEGAETHVDRDFGVEVAWDIPLLDNYPWIKLKNISPRRAVGKFFGLINPGVWRLIRSGKFDAVLMFTGYMCATFWIAMAAAKLFRIPILFGTDATSLAPRDAKRWKVSIKKRLLPVIFRLANIVIAPSEAGRQYMRTLGVAEPRIVLAPFVVDNDWWGRCAAEVNRSQVREQWRIPEEATVALFCAKLQPWKRPQDVLRAFAIANPANAYLVFAGDGPLREELETEAKLVGIAERVRFLGFVNQTGLPNIYCSSDVLVLPSEYDPCPVVVCEAMLCGCPVLLSDHIRGRFDLVRHGETGFIYPCGDIEALAALLRKKLSDREGLHRYSEAARRRMTEWSPRAYVDSLIQAVRRALNPRRGEDPPNLPNPGGMIES